MSTSEPKKLHLPLFTYSRYGLELYKQYTNTFARIIIVILIIIAVIVDIFLIIPLIAYSITLYGALVVYYGVSNNAKIIVKRYT